MEYSPFMIKFIPGSLIFIFLFDRIFRVHQKHSCRQLNGKMVKIEIRVPAKTNMSIKSIFIISFWKYSEKCNYKTRSDVYYRSTNRPCLLKELLKKTHKNSNNTFFFSSFELILFFKFIIDP